MMESISVSIERPRIGILHPLGGPPFRIVGSARWLEKSFILQVTPPGSSTYFIVCLAEFSPRIDITLNECHFFLLLLKFHIKGVLWLDFSANNFHCLHLRVCFLCFLLLLILCRLLSQPSSATRGGGTTAQHLSDLEQRIVALGAERCGGWSVQCVTYHATSVLSR